MEIIDAPEQRVAPATYAGFWLRFVAYLIDALLLSVVQWIIIAPFLALFGISMFSMGNMEDLESIDDGSKAAFLMFAIGTYATAIVGSIILNWLYYSLMESSSKQATLGKMAISLKVTDMHGNRITFLNATGRYFGKIISAMILMVGYIMAGFTEKKQALHDMMAGTLVLRKD